MCAAWTLKGGRQRWATAHHVVTKPAVGGPATRTCPFDRYATWQWMAFVQRILRSSSTDSGQANGGTSGGESRHNRGHGDLARPAASLKPMTHSSGRKALAGGCGCGPLGLASFGCKCTCSPTGGPTSQKFGEYLSIFFFFLPQKGSTGWLTAKPANRALSNNVDAWSHSQSSRTMAKKYVEAAIDHLLVLIAVLFPFISNNHLTNKAQKLSVAGFVQSN